MNIRDTEFAQAPAGADADRVDLATRQRLFGRSDHLHPVFDGILADENNGRVVAHMFDELQGTRIITLRLDHDHRRKDGQPTVLFDVGDQSMRLIFRAGD